LNRKETAYAEKETCVLEVPLSVLNRIKRPTEKNVLRVNIKAEKNEGMKFELMLKR
jgi:hypothetical protein